MADEVSRKALLTAVRNCFTFGDYSDLTITCGGDTYNVHRIIVCSRASVFAMAVKFGGTETSQGKIDLPADDPVIVKLLVRYLYEAEYDPPLSSIPKSVKTIQHGFLHVRINTTQPLGDGLYSFAFPHNCSPATAYCTTENLCPHHKCLTDCGGRCRDFIYRRCKVPAWAAEQLVTHAQMYEYADKYAVVGLKDLAKAKFKAACHIFWAEDSFGQAAHHVFASTVDEDRGVRDIVSATIVKHMELIHEPEIKKLLTKFNGLSLGIMEQKSKEHGWGKGAMKR